MGLPKHRKSDHKSLQFTANQVQVTSMMPQLTANQYKHRKSQQITANQSMSAYVERPMRCTKI